jgi:hypothetical protein
MYRISFGRRSVTDVKMPRAAGAAPITLTFEDLPDDNVLLGGGQNIGGFYPDVTFGPDVTGLSSSRYGYNDAGYPWHSPDTVITSTVDSFDITFARNVAQFGVWYTSFDPLFLTFYDATDASLGVAVRLPYTDGAFGSTDLLWFAAPGIRSVNVFATATQFVLDDFTYDVDAPAAIPEPLPCGCSRAESLRCWSLGAEDKSPCLSSLACCVPIVTVVEKG